MYSHIAKGYTLGHTFARLILRNITSIPGIAIDLIAAMFCIPNYSSYWDNYYIEYTDGVKVGRMQGICGYVGECLGYVVGGSIGSILGGILYIPDLILRGACHFNSWMNEKFNEIAKSIGEHSFFKDFSPYREPSNFFAKAWNISGATLGLALGATLAVVPKIAEFFLPFMGNYVSRALWVSGGYAGGVLGSIIATPVFPIKHLCNRLSDLYLAFRDKVQSLTAFVYAKNNQKLYQDPDCCIPSNSIHSNEFREKYDQYKLTSTAELLFGPFRNDNIVAKPADPLTCPITQDTFTDAVVDREGHTFNRKEIYQWLDNRKECPMSRHKLIKEDLVPNLAVNEIARNYTLKKR